jgi:hypothetical protein
VRGRRTGARFAELLLALIVAACAPTNPSTQPSGAFASEPAPERAEVAMGCMSVDAAECRFIAEHVVAVLPAERGPAFSIQIQLFGCANDGPCPRTLGVREGRAIVDYADGGEPIQLSLAGPPQAPRIVAQQGSWSGLVEASSPRVAGFGPFPFELGHCGLSHVVDFDGSFWVPVGQVDGDAPGLINSERGRILLVAPNVARYLGPGGFTAQLARFPGPRHFWLCD